MSAKRTQSRPFTEGNEGNEGIHSNGVTKRRASDLRYLLLKIVFVSFAIFCEIFRVFGVCPPYEPLFLTNQWGF